jgi:hypothetical protein
MMNFITTKPKEELLMPAQNIKYITCKHYNAKIALTKQNSTGKCPFRFCENCGYDSKEPKNLDLHNKYLGVSKFSVDLGDVVMCIDTQGDNLVCLTTGYPSVHVVSESEFKNLLNTAYLY